MKRASTVSSIGADAVVRQLEALGVDVVFGYPGGAIMPLYDALLASSVEHVLMRHEQAAAFAAVGYARATGRMGVCIGTSGPGATNLMTGVADAMADGVPLLVLTGQVASTALGTDAFQEVDTFGVALPITKHCAIVRSASELSAALVEASHIATHQRPGPVWLDLPKDVLSAPCGGSPTLVPREPSRSAPSDLDLARAAAIIEGSERPLLVLGAGAAADDCHLAIERLRERQCLPMVVTLHGIGAVSSGARGHLGMLGMHGSRAANLAVSRSDLLICLGMRFDDRATGSIAKFAPKAQVLHVDVDPSQLGRVRAAEVAIVSHVDEFISRLHVTRRSSRAWLNACLAWCRTQPPTAEAADGAIDPRGLLRILTERAGVGAVFVADVGQHQMWLAQHGYFHGPRTHLTSGGLGAMGFALPAALGAQIACPRQDTYVVTGDGSIQMNVQELATLARLDMPVRIVLLDNAGLGMVRQWQETFYGGRESSVALDDNPDFVRLANSYGIEAFEVNRAADVPVAVKRLVGARRPLLCHVRIPSELGVWPLVPPGAACSEMLRPLD